MRWDTDGNYYCIDMNIFKKPYLIKVFLLLIIFRLINLDSSLIAQSFLSKVGIKPSDLLERELKDSDIISSSVDNQYFNIVSSIATYNHNYNILKQNYKNKKNRFESLKHNKTRQLDNAKRLFDISAPAVVLLATLDLSSTGAGVIIDEIGTIITNSHVLDIRFEKIIVILYNENINSFADTDSEEKYYARISAIDEKRDLAMLKLEKFKEINFKHLELGSEYKINMADDVFAIGHPLDLMWTPSWSYINRIRNNFETDSFFGKVIQTQMPINPGNSGGPMLNKNGQVVGINFYSKGGQGLNFAIHISEVNRFIEEVEKNKHKPNFGTRTFSMSWKEVDRNSNGIADGYVAVTHDSFIWFKEDFNEDGIIDRWMFDTNGDDIYDILVYDKGKDGTFEIYVVDKDLNGEMDSIRIYTDGDLVPELDYDFSEALLESLIH